MRVLGETFACLSCVALSLHKEALMNELILPWPPKELSPNARVHWAVKSKHAKKLKQTCWAIAVESGVKLDPESMVDLYITFRPSSRRRQDMDNMLARAKYALDGVALALGVDDSKFRLHLEIGEPVKGGAIVVSMLQGSTQ